MPLNGDLPQFNETNIFFYGELVILQLINKSKVDKFIRIVS
jgi:hypothetical protein